MLGLASVGGIQVLLTPRTGIGGRLRGLRDFRRNVVLHPCLIGAEEIGVGWRRSETSLVDECARKLIIFVPGRCRGCWEGSRLFWRHNDGSPLRRTQQACATFHQ